MTSELGQNAPPDCRRARASSHGALQPLQAPISHINLPSRPITDQVASLASTVSEFPPAANALLDRLEVTAQLCVGSPATEALRLRAWEALASSPLLHRSGAVSFAWRCPRSGADLTLGGRLMRAASGTSCLATSGSVLRLNPLSYLRSQVDHDGARSLDGGDNLVGPADADRRHLLGLQLLTVGGLVDSFVAACSEAAGERLVPRLFVRSAELCRDVLAEDAPALARAIAGAAGPWFADSKATWRAGDREVGFEGNLATATWRNGRTDAVARHKFYAKTNSLLRHELSLDGGAAVALFGWDGAPLGAAGSGRELCDRLGHLAMRAQPVLDDMAAWSRGFSAPPCGSLQLMAALAPLLRLSAPPPRRRSGGRPLSRTLQHGRAALAALLSAGRFDASSVPTDSHVRKTLRQLATEGVLVHEPRSRAPIFALCQGLLGARLPVAQALGL